MNVYSYERIFFYSILLAKLCKQNNKVPKIPPEPDDHLRGRFKDRPLADCFTTHATRSRLTGNGSLYELVAVIHVITEVMTGQSAASS